MRDDDTPVTAAETASVLLESTNALSDAAGASTEERSRATALKQLQQKWGRDAIAVGWVALPSILLERQDALGLDAVDINIILHIAKHWFEPGNLPHPSKGSIAKAMQITPRAVQKRIARLHELGFLTRMERRGPKGTKGSQTSQYGFSGLVQKLEPYAVEALQEREKRRQMTIARLRRKKPVVDADDDIV